VTKVLKFGENHLVLEVSNAPTLSTIPAIATCHGAKGYPIYGSVGRVSIVGWMPYGGIIRPVSLLITDAVYLRGMKVEVKPNLKTHDAQIRARARLRNGSGNARTVDPRGTVAGLNFHIKSAYVAGGGDAEVTWTGTLKGVHLWSVKDRFFTKRRWRFPAIKCRRRLACERYE
jgi:beta-glucuronidase